MQLRNQMCLTIAEYRTWGIGGTGIYLLGPPCSVDERADFKVLTLVLLQWMLFFKLLESTKKDGKLPITIISLVRADIK